MKDKNEKRTLIITTIVCLIPVVIGAILYPQLPDTVVTHWDANGVPNGTQSKFVGILVFPGSLVLLNLLVPVLLRVDPKYNNIDAKVKNLIQWIFPVVCIFASSSTLASALGREVPVITLGSALIGVLFIAIGNYLPKMKQSYTVGIKVPWTLNSEENWNRTHRMAGFLWMICGILIVISGIFGFGSYVIPVLFILMVAVPVAYSYLLFRKGI